MGAVVCSLFIMAGCTLSGINSEENIGEITEADLEAASKIIGESLSDQNSGVMASLNDAVTTFSSSGFGTSSAVSGSGGTVQDHDNSGRGSERNFSYSYDPETGIHTIAFERIVFDGDFSKSVVDTLKYIFTDNSGNFIAFPRQEKDRIETIDFKGFREGSIESSTKNSFFTRQDTFLIDGLTAATEILSIDGVHNGNGNFEGTNDEGDEISKSYDVNIEFLNIQIEKAVVEANGSLEEGVTGTLTFSINIRESKNGNSETKKINGTVEMNGDGTALLRFDGFRKVFQILLHSGEAKDQDNEFAGHIKHVNIEQSTFTLKNGRVVKLTDNTEVHAESDVMTLEEVALALENGDVVEAEGRGHVEGDLFIASKVKFEVAEDNHSDNTVDFEDLVVEVAPDDGLFALESGKEVRVTDNTEIDDSGDFQSLAAVADALADNKKVAAIGRGEWSTEVDNRIVATRVKFRLSD
ncbi:MAG: DUF5666 domain-containing protein [Balneolaceae bacterium]|nr:DUF5666 domain-containing protein [Balneolaceae bacterium]